MIDTTIKDLKEGELNEIKLKDEYPKLELKPLSSHLRYAILDEDKRYPVVANASLTKVEEEKLLRISRDYKQALGWTIDDIKGISPAICKHKILMEDEFKPIEKL